MRRRRARALLLRPAVPGMPEDLADAIYDMDAFNREVALANWDGIGPDGRQLLIHYLNAVYLRWSRPGRCKLAALNSCSRLTGRCTCPTPAGSDRPGLQPMPRRHRDALVDRPKPRTWPRPELFEAACAWTTGRDAR